MQKELIKLDEIIWEICGACKNGCSYCGSKDGWNTHINDATIRTISDRIVEYKKAKEINISGGDPLLVPLATHAYITANFNSANIKPKILINPRSFRLETNREDKYKILDMYSWIGVSINEQCEIDYFNEHVRQWIRMNNRVTIISNFNVSNIFMFEKIRELVTKHNLYWQIQYTMFSDSKDGMALYNREEANKYFYERIQSAMDNGTKIVIADNMNEGTCGAGRSSIGILSNGDVVPCLSMRSWMPDLSTVVQGNLIEQPLNTIWETMFRQYRFGTFNCCKDYCNNKCFKKEEKPREHNLLPLYPTLGPDSYKPIVVPSPIDRCVLYAVTDIPSVTVYAVFSELNTPCESNSFNCPPFNYLLDDKNKDIT